MSLNDNAAQTSPNFDRVFGNKSTTNKVTNIESAKDRPKAQVWINVGYMVNVPVEGGGTETQFVALPVGIPVDTMERHATNSQNDAFRARQQAGNDLLDKILARAAQLKPGEDVIYGEVGGLQIQVRRVKDDALPIPADQNPFITTLSL
jgi:hypothetical protein